MYQRHWNLSRRSLRGSVDWNSVKYFLIASTASSLPSWECGLKYMHVPYLFSRLSVAPFVGVWIEIEKKWKKHIRILSRSLRGSVDWNNPPISVNNWANSRSLRGSVDWNQFLEIVTDVPHWSLPSWECGLKSTIGGFIPLVTESLPSWECGLKFSLWYLRNLEVRVAPFVGVWIEISFASTIGTPCECRSLRGSVDWNWIMYCNL